MSIPQGDSLVGHSFGLEFDGITIQSITEVTGLKMEQDVIELKENSSDGKYVIKKLPGRWKAAEITLTRGLTNDQSFDQWIKDSQFGKMSDARKGGAIIVYDYEGNAIKRYQLTNAWPKSLEIGSMKAGDTSVLTEKLVLTTERLEVG
ncbi:MAG TPA: phage tail protein [Streptosporangiaceae bacterium]|jgi:phage tail-like protein|nr:phage tail protein [Streptosporangiaceae bacterium]